VPEFDKSITMAFSAHLLDARCCEHGNPPSGCGQRGDE
jgi:hypothetical protein